MSTERLRALVSVIVGLLLSSTFVDAHHGSGISYDMVNLWTTKATVVEFNYANPHPWMTFDRVNDKGQVEQWTAELITNPTFLLRAGWTKARTLAAMKPGTVVELTLGTSKAGGLSGCIRTIRNEQGELIVNSGGAGGDAPVNAPARGQGAGQGQGGGRGRQ